MAKNAISFGAVVLCILGSALHVDGITCGDKYTQVTICFPGSSKAANCEFVITNNTKLSEPLMLQLCPREPLFGKNCTALPGVLNLAYGPCLQAEETLSLSTPNAVSQPPADAGKPQRPIREWLTVLGLQQITEVGGLLLRGYVFQQGPISSTDGLPVVPGLTKIGTLLPNSLDTVQLSPLTILGAAVPQLPFVTQLEDGITIQNTPNVNFSTNFPALQKVSGPIRIVGNARLTSLDGLQGLGLAEAVNSLLIIGNPRLRGISAFKKALGCRNGQSLVLKPDFVLGVIQVIPKVGNVNGTSCLISTAGQACKFIANGDCPPGTDFDGRLR